MMPQAQWQVEGDLLEVQMAIDRLAKKGSLSPEEEERLEDLGKRKRILQERLRKERMRI